MCRLRTLGFAADLVLLPPALLVLHVQDRLRPAAAVITAWPPLARLRARMSRLPPAAALPLFLVPEACSRLGWLASAWLLLQGQAWQSFAVYAATKLFAGCAALWIYRACEPALLRVPWFARCHAAVFGRGRRWLLLRRWRALLRRLRPEAGPLPGQPAWAAGGGRGADQPGHPG